VSISAFPPARANRRSSAGLRRLVIQEHLTGYLFILPAVALISLFGIFPIAYAFYMSLYRWRVRQGSFLGLANYERALGDWWGALFFVGGFLLLALAYGTWTSSRRVAIARLGGAVLAFLGATAIARGWGMMTAAGDRQFLNSLIITLYYALGTVPAELILSLILAYVLFQNIRGRDLFRMVYFLPYITPVVATAVVFRTIFSPRETSLANQALALLGLEPQKWLFEPRPFLQVMFGWEGSGLLAGPSMALVSIIAFGIWTYVGYNTVIFLAGLGAIPRELYEAAQIDGASRIGLFRYITLPLLSPVTFYLTLIAFIGTFKAFNHIWVMQVPSAQNTVEVASVAIFNTFYKANQFGYAAAQAILLFLIILGLTLAQNKVLGERVFYG